MFDPNNPYRIAIQKYAQQLLGDRYGRYHDLLTRLSSQIVTQKDMADFGQLFVDMFNAGYVKSVEDYRKAIESHGFKVEIKEEK